MTTSGLAAQLNRWIEVDPDDETAAELERLQRSDPEGATALFDGRIGFGTAGLRAAMGPGPRRMNRLVVRQTTAGLMQWLVSSTRSGYRAAPAPTVVIGFDARHRSAEFAADAASEVVDGGGVAVLFDGPAPTPVIAHELLTRQADAAIVITASHNPPADNGYKLYLGDGIQLVSPADQEIAAMIDQVAAEHLAGSSTNRHDSVLSQLSMAASGGRLDLISADEATERHRSVVVAALGGTARDVRILYTAMHGVGGEPMVAALRQARFPAPMLVDEQFKPNPNFPTTPFPNPEEPGALDLAYRTASAASTDGSAPGTDLILANDPDADRLAVAVPTAAGWRRLTGDEVGALLADHLLRAWSTDNDGGKGRAAVVASSIVSSRFIDRLAAHYGAGSIRTLTGFKWVARPIVERSDAVYLFGYEEALGYCVNPAVRDKDGISAGLLVAEIAAGCKARGETLLDRLDELARRFGLVVTGQVSIGFGHLGPGEQDELRHRAATLNPTVVADIDVVSVENLRDGRTLPPTDGVVIELADSSRIIVRPSGTEPKIKAYLEVVGDDEIAQGDGTPEAATHLDDLRQNAKYRLDRLETSVRRLLVG